MKQVLSTIAYGAALRAIALALTLLFAPGCASSVKSGHSADSTVTNPQDDHAMSHGETPVSDHSTTHNEHSMNSMGEQNQGESTSLTQAKITIPKTIKTNQPVLLQIDIQDEKAKAITQFDPFQEKLMHLIVVNENLDYFNHLHPTYKQNGRFEVEANFSNPGNYTLFSDYKPAGKPEQVSVLNVQVPGNRPSTSEIDLNRAKIFRDTSVKLTSQPSVIKAKQNVNLMFDLREKNSNQPIKDLQPYLGETGHLVIVKQSSPLTQADYIHAHALKDTPTGQVHFMTHFPQPGNYKIWGQFNRNGEIITADFWVKVE